MIDTSTTVYNIQVYPVLLRTKGLDTSLDLSDYKIYSELKNYSKNQITYKILFSSLIARDNFIKSIKGYTFKLCSPKFFYFNDNEETVLND